MNLTRARKSRARDEKRQAADANAAKHGRTKVEREAEARATEKAAHHLDQHRRDRDEEA